VLPSAAAAGAHHALLLGSTQGSGSRRDEL
jgi:hypothetical protein